MNELSFALTVPAELNPGGIVVRMAGTNERPLFCLADVCAVLGIGNPSDVARRIPEDEKTTLDIVEGGGPGRTFVTEGGLYRTILTSRTDRSEPFRKWVCGEVLPCIRQHGCYPAPAEGRVVERLPADLAALIQQEIQTALSRSPVLIGLPVTRKLDWVNPYEFIQGCWPDCPPKIPGKIVQRMDTNYIHIYRRPAPKLPGPESAPLMCDREYLHCLTEAIQYFMRKHHARIERERQPRLPLPPGDDHT